MVAFVAITPMALKDDLVAVAALERLAKGGWTQEQLESQLAQPDGWQYVARRQADKEPVGYVCGRNVLPEAEVYRIVVHEQCRQQGVGRMLMAHALEEIQRQGVQDCFLECRETNQAALYLYAGLGFKVTGRRKYYYRDPREDAVLLRLSFSEGAIA